MGLGEKQIQSAIRYNVWSSQHVFEHGGLPAQFWGYSDEKVCPVPNSALFAQLVANFQSKHGLKADGKLGTRTLGKIHEVYPKEASEAGGDVSSAEILLTGDARSEIVQFTVAFEGGKHDPYAGMNKDAEYEGWFDQPRAIGRKRLHPSERAKQPTHKPHRASKYHPSGGFHIGLSYGAWQAAQEPGSLGMLLTVFHKRAPDIFKEVFGPDWEELLEVTTSRNKRKGKFSSRTRPVGGAYLWKEPWLSRFEEAARHEIFRRAQRDWVGSVFLDRVLPIAEEYCLDSKGDLAVLFDIAVQFGVGGLRRFVRKARMPENDNYDPERIQMLIRALPRKHHARRLSILNAAGQSVRYTW